VPYLALAGQMEAAREKARELASVFDGRFYLEVQANKLAEQQRVNRMLREISQDLSIPLVGTNDCHYLNREDAEAHDVLLCIQTGKSVDDIKRLKFSSDEFYFKSRAEMEEALSGYEDALDNTVHVAERCDYKMSFGVYKFPVFRAEKDQSLNDMLTDKAREGLVRRLAQKEEEEGPLSEAVRAEYRDRLEFELSVVAVMG